jgi:hypothetical protein
MSKVAKMKIEVKSNTKVQEKRNKGLNTMKQEKKLKKKKEKMQVNEEDLKNVDALNKEGVDWVDSDSR